MTYKELVLAEILNKYAEEEYSRSAKSDDQESTIAFPKVKAAEITERLLEFLSDR